MNIYRSFVESLQDYSNFFLKMLFLVFYGIIKFTNVTYGYRNIVLHMNLTRKFYMSMKKFYRIETFYFYINAF